jgi:hypothetical protein
LDASLTERVKEEEEEGCIADSGYFEEFNFMSAPSNIQCQTSFYLYCSSTPLEIYESVSSVPDSPPPKALKSRAQRFEDVLGILREGRLWSSYLMTQL